MIKDLTNIALFAKAIIDIAKEKIELKTAEMLIQVKTFADKDKNKESLGEQVQTRLKEKAKEGLTQLLSEINHRAQISQTNFKSYIKDKLTELTNNALLDSVELNDIRAEIATLRAEIADLKVEKELAKIP